MVWKIRCAALALFVALPGSARAATPPVAGGLNQSFRGDSAKLTVTSLPVMAPRFGFVPLRLAIDNQQSRDVTWDASFNSTSYEGNVANNQHVEDRLVVPGGRSHERWMFVPLADGGLSFGGYSYRGPFTGTISGSGLGNVSFHLNSHSGGGRPNNMVPWAVSVSLESIVRGRISALQDPSPAPSPVPMRFRGRPPRSTPPGVRPLVTGAYHLSPFDPAQSLGDWRVWSPFARVVLRRGEFETSDPANRVALRNWVALGGVLYLVPDQAGAGATERFGAGSIVTLAEPMLASDAGDSEGLFSSTGLFNTTLAQPLHDQLSQERTGLSVKIPAAEPPGDWLVYFFIAFAVVVAPVNLFAFAPPRRRHRLFFTVPALSFVAVLGLSLVIFLQDGLGGSGARRALVVLLPGENQAAVFQEQVSRTGLLFGTQFPLANDTLCAQVVVQSSPQGAQGADLERTHDSASGDWFRSRARQGQHLRRLTPTRARVERVGISPDGAPIVQSSVGTMLRDFYYVDSASVGWTAEQLPPGTRVTLERLPRDSGITRGALEFGEAGSLHFRELVQSCAPASPGRFVARAGDSELAPLPTLAAIRWEESAVMFTGVLENDGAKTTAAPGRSAP